MNCDARSVVSHTKSTIFPPNWTYRHLIARHMGSVHADQYSDSAVKIARLQSCSSQTEIGLLDMNRVGIIRH